MSLNMMPELSSSEKQFRDLLNNQFGGDLSKMYETYMLNGLDLDKDVEEVLIQARNEQSAKSFQDTAHKLESRLPRLQMASVPEHLASLLRERGLYVPSDEESASNIDPNIEI
jgi:hypothetical protein